MGGCCDPGIAQNKAVAHRIAFRLRCETGPIERAVEKFTGTISGKHATGTVSSVGAGREANDEEAGVRIAERGHRFAPVLPVVPGAAFGHGYSAAMVGETRTFFARDDLPGK